MVYLSDVNLVAVVAATVLNMLLGMVWYSKSAFGTMWMQLAGLTEADMKKADMKKSFSIGIVATFLTAYVLNYVVMLTGAQSVSEIMTVALLVWLAAVVPMEMHGVAWELRSPKLLVINTAHALVSFFIAVFVVQNWMF